MSKEQMQENRVSHSRIANMQPPLFAQLEQSEEGADSSSRGCNIVAVGKRRDGGTRYWCLRHRADATAKHGKPAHACRAAHVPPIPAEDVFPLDISKYAGGIALWGAVPAVYDTTRLPMDRGIHVHTRVTAQPEKEIDCTFRAVRILERRLPREASLFPSLRLSTTWLLRYSSTE